MKVSQRRFTTGYTNTAHWLTCQTPTRMAANQFAQGCGRVPGRAARC